MKKVLTFIGVLTLLLSITIGMPVFMYNRYLTSTYFSEVKNDQGVMIPKTMDLSSKISNEVENKNNVSELTKEYQNILTGKFNDVLNLVITFGIAIVLVLTIITIILMRANSKLLGTVFMVAIIINIIAYAILYYVVGVLKVVV